MRGGGSQQMYMLYDDSANCTVVDVGESDGLWGVC